MKIWPNEMRPDIYNSGMVTIGEGSVIPPKVSIGKNVAIFGHTEEEEYPNGRLESVKNIIKAGVI